MNTNDLGRLSFAEEHVVDRIRWRWFIGIVLVINLPLLVWISSDSALFDTSIWVWFVVLCVTSALGSRFGETRGRARVRKDRQRETR